MRRRSPSANARAGQLSRGTTVSLSATATPLNARKARPPINWASDAGAGNSRGSSFTKIFISWWYVLSDGSRAASKNQQEGHAGAFSQVFPVCARASYPQLAVSCHFHLILIPVNKAGGSRPDSTALFRFIPSCSYCRKRRPSLRIEAPRRKRRGIIVGATFWERGLPARPAPPLPTPASLVPRPHHP